MGEEALAGEVTAVETPVESEAPAEETPVEESVVPVAEASLAAGWAADKATEARSEDRDTLGCAAEYVVEVAPVVATVAPVAEGLVAGSAEAAPAEARLAVYRAVGLAVDSGVQEMWAEGAERANLEEIQEMAPLAGARESEEVGMAAETEEVDSD